MANLSNINNKLIVTDGGNLLVNKTAANNAAVGVQLMSTGDVNGTVSGDTVARFNRLGTDGEIIRFQHDTSTDGAINSLSGRIAIGSGNTGIFFDSIRQVVTPHNMTTNGNEFNNISFGRNLIRFKDVYLSGKVVAGTGSTDAATINAFSTTVSAGLHSALRIIENTGASSYWDIGATNGASTILNFYHNGTTTPKITFTHTGGATFAGNVTVSGTSSSFNTGNSGTFTTNDASNYPRFTLTNSSAQIGLFRAGGNAGGMYIGGSGDGFRLYTTGFAQKLLVDQSGNATFAGTVTAAGYSGPGQGLDNLLPLGVYSTTPGTAGVLIKTNIVSNDYGFIFGTINLEQFNFPSVQRIQLSATVASNGTVATKAATSDIAITMKLFHTGGYWYIHLPMPSTYVTVSAYIYTGAGYQGQAKGFNEVNTITVNPVPSGATSSVDIVADVYLTTGTSSPWLKNGNDIYNSNSGNVGIGYTGPYNQISGGETTLAIADADNASLYLKSNATGGHNHILFSGTGGALSFYDKTRGDYNMIINSSGNVGIGTTSPQRKLHVTNSADGFISRFTGGANSDVNIGIFGHSTSNFGSIGTESNDRFSLFTNGFDRLNITNGGNVGIGITNPQDKLHVNGDAIISSTKFGDFAVASINTTGYAIATVGATTNGQSACVEFIATGGAGAYYNVVYTCYNGAGNWYYTKNVVGSGGNIEVAETNGSGSSTLVFYFRATSGVQGYTPRVMMKGTPYALVTF